MCETCRRTRPGSATVLLTAMLATGLAPDGTAQPTYTEITGTAAGLRWDGGRTELELGDLNGDGHADVVTVGDHGSPFINTQMHGITAWLGDGAGGWTLVQTGRFGYGGLALGDANGDGVMDVGYGIHHNYSRNDLGDQLLEVATGDGSGTAWTPWDDGLATNGETWGMFGTDFGDIDGDGDLDVGSVSFGCCAGVHVYRNEGDGTWTQTFGFLGGNSDMTFQFADFNGDGHLDFVAGHQSAAVHLGDGSGGFRAATGNLPASAWRAAAAGDVDGDGTDELAFRSGSGGLEVWSWAPNNRWVRLTGNLPSSGTYSVSELVDMDNDGNADLLGFANGMVRLFSWQPGNTWSLRTETPVGTAAVRRGEALRGGVDLDHNGFADFAVVQDEGTGGLFGSSRNRLRIFAESSVATALRPHVTAPTNGRVWLGGQVRFIDWTCAVPAGQVATIDLELSTTGPTGPWSTLATALPNNGRHQLVVPRGISSAACVVRITAATAAGRAVAIGNPFSVEPPAARVVAFGCGVNPSGSLTILSGQPVPGGTVSLGIDNPLGTQSAGSATVLVLAPTPDPRFPCGTLLPGWGMAGAGAAGELLLSMTVPSVWQPIAGPPWTGAPAAVSVQVPATPLPSNASVFAQGAVVDLGASSGGALGLTTAIELRPGT